MASSDAILSGLREVAQELEEASTVMRNLVESLQAHGVHLKNHGRQIGEWGSRAQSYIGTQPLELRLIRSQISSQEETTRTLEKMNGALNMIYRILSQMNSKLDRLK